MKNKWMRPLLFTVTGGLLGLVYYYFFACSTGTCVITSNPMITMVYMGIIGWLLSCLFEKGGEDKCNM